MRLAAQEPATNCRNSACASSWKNISPISSGSTSSAPRPRDQHPHLRPGPLGATPGGGPGNHRAGLAGKDEGTLQHPGGFDGPGGCAPFGPGPEGSRPEALPQPGASPTIGVRPGGIGGGGLSPRGGLLPDRPARASRKPGTRPQELVRPGRSAGRLRSSWNPRPPIASGAGHPGPDPEARTCPQAEPGGRSRGSWARSPAGAISRPCRAPSTPPG